MPSVYIRPVLRSDVKNTASATGAADDANSMETFECPVFINKARQFCALSLPLNSRDPTSKWIMAGAGIILDPGTTHSLTTPSPTHSPTHSPTPSLTHSLILTHMSASANFYKPPLPSSKLAIYTMSAV